MSDFSPPQTVIDRRWLFKAGIAISAGWLTCPALSWANPDVAPLLRQSGVVLALRHALAPGNFDPPDFRLDDCSTQRNLSNAGRLQAQRIGTWLSQQQLVPSRVRSSPWCRCMDTAMLAFGKAESWSALGSPVGYSETTGPAHLNELRLALAKIKSDHIFNEAEQSAHKKTAFEVWVTHMFVLSDLLSTSIASGEGLIIKADANNQPRVLARVVPH